MSKKNRLVVANAGWAGTLPEWLKQEVREERLTLGIVDAVKKTEKVGDAEVCTYLYTASLTAPMPHNWNGIYLFLAARLMRRRGKQIPDFMAEKLEAGLVPDEARELESLRRELYRRRGGEIAHPLLDALREAFRTAARAERRRAA